jgi:host factor-I protein
MKNVMEPTSVGRATDADSFGNRKLIRPSLNRAEGGPERRERPERPAAPAAAGKKVPPPEQTHAENFYYQKQMQARTPMVIQLQDGEELHGIIEWYDKNCIKITREGEPNLLVYKPAIKYMFKEGEQNERR